MVQFPAMLINIIIRESQEKAMKQSSSSVDSHCLMRYLVVERVVDFNSETGLSLPIFHESEFDPPQAHLKHLLIITVRRNQRLKVNLGLTTSGTKDRE